MSSIVLEAESIRKSYRDGSTEVPVLHEVSLGLRRGEVVSLVGPSGSGKTTLLSILGCLLSPSSGGLAVDGRRVDLQRTESLVEIRKRSIGFVFQQFNLFPALTARENVEFALNIRGTVGPAARAEAGRVLASVGLADRLEFRPGDLSGGQKQRVAIARALAGSPAVLLADEPTANLDSRTAGQVLGLFRDLARTEGAGLLIVTHDPLVRGFADRILRLEAGRLAA
jgi:putative ABC transport system ATP-binding protein